MTPAQLRQLAATRLTSSSKSAWAERVEAALRDAADQLEKQPNRGSLALQDVVVERARQINAEGWTETDDDEKTDGSLAQAAACYALNVQKIPVSCGDSTLWPESWDLSWWKPKDRRRDLVRAGALLLAEIERMDRAGGAL